jgi:predicted nucleotidyltransferase
MHERIAAVLDEIEEREEVTIFYACESGSRAWGFASQDSDYDVRFLYVHSRDWYLSIEPGRDVIERPLEDVLDVSGWDLRKALGLLRKSNPPLLEWLQSPVVYRQRPELLSLITEVMPQYYAPRSCLYHYLHMARNNHREYLKGELVRVKKYLYVLRPVLACLWIERDLGLVPVRFSDLVDGVVDAPRLREAIEGLVRRKEAGLEQDYGPKIGIISQFLDEEITRLTGIHVREAVTRDSAGLDEVFREALRRA